MRGGGSLLDRWARCSPRLTSRFDCCGGVRRKQGLGQPNSQSRAGLQVSGEQSEPHAETTTLVQKLAFPAMPPHKSVARKIGLRLTETPPAATLATFVNLKSPALPGATFQRSSNLYELTLEKLVIDNEDEEQKMICRLHEEESGEKNWPCAKQPMRFGAWACCLYLAMSGSVTLRISHTWGTLERNRNNCSVKGEAGVDRVTSVLVAGELLRKGVPEHQTNSLHLQDGQHHNHEAPALTALYFVSPRASLQFDVEKRSAPRMFSPAHAFPSASVADTRMHRGPRGTKEMGQVHNMRGLAASVSLGGADHVYVMSCSSDTLACLLSLLLICTLGSASAKKVQNMEPKKPGPLWVKLARQMQPPVPAMPAYVDSAKFRQTNDFPRTSHAIPAELVAKFKELEDSSPAGLTHAAVRLSAEQDAAHRFTHSIVHGLGLAPLSVPVNSKIRFIELPPSTDNSVRFFLHDGGLSPEKKKRPLSVCCTFRGTVVNLFPPHANPHSYISPIPALLAGHVTEELLNRWRCKTGHFANGGGVTTSRNPSLMILGPHKMYPGRGNCMLYALDATRQTLLLARGR
ncbi:hypothetical protein B566_EDAN015569 [Ephemera danica]|nr:hypothetical protein B566_EDAN015569 [Ephemera danica]